MIKLYCLAPRAAPGGNTSDTYLSFDVSLSLSIAELNTSQYITNICCRYICCRYRGQTVGPDRAHHSTSQTQLSILMVMPHWAGIPEC